jgi:putative transcription factor
MCGLKFVKLNSAVVDGSFLDVCNKCSSYGNTIKIKEPKFKKYVGTSKVQTKIFVEENVNFVMEGAGKIIKSVREGKKLNQKDFAKMIGTKVSVLHKIETCFIKPEISLAKKIEKILDIRIIESYNDDEKSISLNLTDEELTVGDLIKFKKR